MGIRNMLAVQRDRFSRHYLKYRKPAPELPPIVLESRGHCPICDRSAVFIARNAWLRDHFICQGCHSIPRERALMAVLQQSYPQWRQLRIHESSPIQRGASLKLARECSDYIPSQYFPTRAPGSIGGGVRCENLEALTFADESLDLHITQDVLEHIPRPEKAFAEIARTLKPGGAHIFTVPIVNRCSQSAMRISIDDRGSISHLVAPEYHGNPVDDQGSLVTIDWGFDIVEKIAAACGLKTEIHRLDDLSLGIRAELIEVLVTRKPL
jgi:SAM-dependent methyltransferase